MTIQQVGPACFFFFFRRARMNLLLVGPDPNTIRGLQGHLVPTLYMVFYSRWAGPISLIRRSVGPDDSSSIVGPMLFDIFSFPKKSTWSYHLQKKLQNYIFKKKNNIKRSNHHVYIRQNQGFEKYFVNPGNFIITNMQRWYSKI